MKTATAGVEIADRGWEDARHCKQPTMREVSRRLTVYLRGKGDDQNWRRVKIGRKGPKV